MTVVTRVRIDTSRFDRKMRNLRSDLRRPEVVYGKAANQVTRYIHGTIKQQGRKRAYAPLSPFYRQITGKRKALLGLIPLIVPASGKSFAGVKFLRRSKDWTVEMHHKGYGIPGVAGKKMKVPTRKGKSIFFTSRKGTRVPGREIIPTKAETQKVVTPVFRAWVNRMAGKWNRG